MKSGGDTFARGYQAIEYPHIRRQHIYHDADVVLKIVDVKIIDGLINGSAFTVDRISASIRKIQTGIVQNYAVMIVVGILVLVSYVLIF